MPISKSDKIFIEKLLQQHELDPDMLEQLDEKLKDGEFKKVYDLALAKKYKSKSGKLKGYLPMIILGILIVLGLYLIIR